MKKQAMGISGRKIAQAQRVQTLETGLGLESLWLEQSE